MFTVTVMITFMQIKVLIFFIILNNSTKQQTQFQCQNSILHRFDQSKSTFPFLLYIIKCVGDDPNKIYILTCNMSSSSFPLTWAPWFKLTLIEIQFLIERSNGKEGDSQVDNLKPHKTRIREDEIKDDDADRQSVWHWLIDCVTD